MAIFLKWTGFSRLRTLATKPPKKYDTCDPAMSLAKTENFKKWCETYEKPKEKLQAASPIDSLINFFRRSPGGIFGTPEKVENAVLQCI